MKTQEAITKAGSPGALASLLGITPSAVSQWGENVPQGREWQMRVIKPEWFVAPDAPADTGQRRRSTDKNKAKA